MNNQRKKAILKKITSAFYGWTFAIAGKLPKSVILSVMLPTICELAEKNSDYFFSFNVRSKKAEDLITKEDKSPHADQFAIIMQGPLVAKDDFTLETIKIYNKIYKDVLVIVSTWKNEDSKYIERIENECKCKVVLTDYPEHGGFMHTNYQAKGTQAGLATAKQLGKTFVFKTRSDYRFTKRGLLEFFYNIIHEYPCVKDEYGLNYRLIFTSGRNDDMYRPHFIGDQFNFGYIDDMLSFWNCQGTDYEKSSKDYYSEREKSHMTWLQDRENCSVLLKNFTKKVANRDLVIDVKTYWDFVKKYLIFVSAKDCNAYWLKYDRFEETVNNGEYYPRGDSVDCLLSYNWDFALWNDLYNGTLNYDVSMENISRNNHF